MKGMRTSLMMGLAVLLTLLHGPVAAGEGEGGRIHYPAEDHLTNIRQLTVGGENAEAYFSFDGSELILQATRGDRECDAIYRMNSDGSKLRQVSSGEGLRLDPPGRQGLPAQAG
jgi:hypothetical protein